MPEFSGLSERNIPNKNSKNKNEIITENTNMKNEMLKELF